MKKQYTEMITSLRRARKLTGLSYEALYERANRIIEEAPSEERTLRRLSVDMEDAYENGKAARHIFMPDRPFCEWLATCAKTLDPALGEAAVAGFGATFVCLHFPTASNLPSALLALSGTVRGGIVIVYSMCHALGGCAFFTKLDGRDPNSAQPFQTLNPDEYTSKEVRQEQADTGEFYTRIVAGLGLYMACFPEQVIDGIPADAKRAEYAAGNAKTIGVSNTVVCRDGPTPHYRSGHFRMLRSQRFANKQGQIVFVTGCFVRGHAKTVLEPGGAQ